MTEDSAELEALFDTVAEQHWGTAQNIQADAVPKEVALGKTEKKAARKKSAKHVSRDTECAAVINEVGHLARSLHDNLRALGCDTELERAATSIPDARDRLAYVAMLTQQAADRVLGATEIAKPLQAALGQEATQLSGRWSELFSGQVDVGAFKQLVGDTRNYLQDLPARTQHTEAQLLEIMMAQDFQDLTGQVLKKVTALVQDIETRLLQVLMDHMPGTRASAAPRTALEGPIVNAQGRSDVVTNQAQVDDLLASLGF